ncbi:MAG: transglutaminase family protein [Ilumatobacteraceae bacterium]
MPWQRQMMMPYLLPPELHEDQLAAIASFAHSIVERNDRDVLGFLGDLTATIQRDFRYASGSTTLETTPYEVLRVGSGVCQDFANLMICAAGCSTCPLATAWAISSPAGGTNTPSRPTYRVGWVYLPLLG